MVGAVEREVPQGGELGLDPVQPGRIGSRTGDFDVVRRGPVADPAVFGCGQVRAEVVADDRDPGGSRVLKEPLRWAGLLEWQKAGLRTLTEVGPTEFPGVILSLIPDRRAVAGLPDCP